MIGRKFVLDALIKAILKSLDIINRRFKVLLILLSYMYKQNDTISAIYTLLAKLQGEGVTKILMFLYFPSIHLK